MMFRCNEVVLDRSSVSAVVRELVAARVAEHVRMHREGQMSELARASHDLLNVRPLHGSGSLAHARRPATTAKTLD